MSSEHISYLLYLVAADIINSNLEPDTPRWYPRGPEAEASSGVVAGSTDQAGPTGPNQRAAELGEAIAKAMQRPG